MNSCCINGHDDLKAIMEERIKLKAFYSLLRSAKPLQNKRVCPSAVSENAKAMVADEDIELRKRKELLLLECMCASMEPVKNILKFTNETENNKVRERVLKQCLCSAIEMIIKVNEELAIKRNEQICREKQNRRLKRLLFLLRNESNNRRVMSYNSKKAPRQTIYICDSSSDNEADREMSKSKKKIDVLNTSSDEHLKKQRIKGGGKRSRSRQKNLNKFKSRLLSGASSLSQDTDENCSQATPSTMDKYKDLIECQCKETKKKLQKLDKVKKKKEGFFSKMARCCKDNKKKTKNDFKNEDSDLPTCSDESLTSIPDNKYGSKEKNRPQKNMMGSRNAIKEPDGSWKTKLTSDESKNPSNYCLQSILSKSHCSNITKRVRKPGTDDYLSYSQNELTVRRKCRPFYDCVDKKLISVDCKVEEPSTSGLHPKIDKNMTEGSMNYGSLHPKIKCRHVYECSNMEVNAEMQSSQWESQNGMLNKDNKDSKKNTLCKDKDFDIRDNLKGRSSSSKKKKSRDKCQEPISSIKKNQECQELISSIKETQESQEPNSSITGSKNNEEAKKIEDCLPLAENNANKDSSITDDNKSNAKKSETSILRLKKSSTPSNSSQTKDHLKISSSNENELPSVSGLQLPPVNNEDTNSTNVDYRNYTECEHFREKNRLLFAYLNKELSPAVIASQLELLLQAETELKRKQKIFKNKNPNAENSPFTTQTATQTEKITNSYIGDQDIFPDYSLTSVYRDLLVMIRPELLSNEKEKKMHKRKMKKHKTVEDCNSQNGRTFKLIFGPDREPIQFKNTNGEINQIQYRNGERYSIQSNTHNLCRCKNKCVNCMSAQRWSSVKRLAKVPKHPSPLPNDFILNPNASQHKHISQAADDRKRKRRTSRHQLSGNKQREHHTGDSSPSTGNKQNLKICYLCKPTSENSCVYECCYTHCEFPDGSVLNKTEAKNSKIIVNANTSENMSTSFNVPKNKQNEKRSQDDFFGNSVEEDNSSSSEGSSDIDIVQANKEENQADSCTDINTKKIGNTSMISEINRHDDIVSYQNQQASHSEESTYTVDNGNNYDQYKAHYSCQCGCNTCEQIKLKLEKDRRRNKKKLGERNTTQHNNRLRKYDSVCNLCGAECCPFNEIERNFSAYQFNSNKTLETYNSDKEELNIDSNDMDSANSCTDSTITSSDKTLSLSEQNYKNYASVNSPGNMKQYHNSKSNSNCSSYDEITKQETTLNNHLSGFNNECEMEDDTKVSIKGSFCAIVRGECSTNVTPIACERNPFASLVNSNTSLPEKCSSNCKCNTRLNGGSDEITLFDIAAEPKKNILHYNVRCENLDQLGNVKAISNTKNTEHFKIKASSFLTKHDNYQHNNYKVEVSACCVDNSKMKNTRSTKRNYSRNRFKPKNIVPFTFRRKKKVQFT